MVTLLPLFPFTHSIMPFFCTTARLVFRLYVFLLQFSMLEYLTLAPSATCISTQPACNELELYCGAEHPSIYSTCAPLSTIIKVCSNWPPLSAFILKYACSGIATFTF